MSHEVIIEFYFVVRLCLHRPLPVHLPVCTLSLFLALYHSTMPPTWFSLYLLLKTLLYTSVYYNFNYFLFILRCAGSGREAHAVQRLLIANMFAVMEKKHRSHDGLSVPEKRYSFRSRHFRTL